jgi:glycosyltransferase involved in cell wall biosynthesis
LPGALRVAVVIPALDEAAALPAVLAAIPAAGDGWRIERTLVVDNGSSDGTGAVARAAGADVRAEPRRGYGSACLAGLAELRRAPPEAVAFLDADGSDDPADLGSVLAPLAAANADLVVGSRVLGDRERGSLTVIQRFGNALAARLLAALYGGTVTDLGPLRAMEWHALESLGMRDRDYGWTVEMQARALRRGLRVIEVPVHHRTRRAGRSKVSGTVRGVTGAGWKILATLLRVRLGG